MERGRVAVIGNGSSLTPEILESLDVPAFAVNRIWRMFDRTSWRPDFYVRGELPSYDPEHVKEDLKEMGRVGCAMYLQDGFRGLEFYNAHPKTRYEYFKTCDGTQEHDWHLPLICGYGTVVNIAVQIAVLEGFSEIELIGCDLGSRHFYDEPFANADLAHKAHSISSKCCPVPIISSLEMYAEKEIYRSGS